MKKGLLLGAGFSYDLGMPLSYDLTEVFFSFFNNKNIGQFAFALAKNNPFGEGRSINKHAIVEGLDLLLRYKLNKCSNYEEYLSNLIRLGYTSGKNQSDRDSYHYLFSEFYQSIHTILSVYQKVSYQLMYRENFKWFSKLENLLSTEETWVFTLNHDIYLECLAIDLGIPVTYGDTESISFPLSNLEMSNKVDLTYSVRSKLTIDSPKYFKGRKGINLVKLHGGLSELSYKDRTIICNPKLDKCTSLDLIEAFKNIENMAYYHQGMRVPSGKDRFITNSSGELDIMTKSMLTGGKKYSKTSNPKKGEEKLKLFDDVLQQLDELTIIGYGFADSHINFRIANAMVLNKNICIKIIDPINNQIPECLAQFDYDSRIRKAICSVAHWMDYCKSQKCNLEQINSLKENAKYRIQVKETVAEVFREESIFNWQ
ncbi:hypothetical protein ACFLZV_04790 [Candidatus Margulisiibacteriota bacterium]